MEREKQIQTVKRQTLARKKKTGEHSEGERKTGKSDKEKGGRERKRDTKRRLPKERRKRVLTRLGVGSRTRPKGPDRVPYGHATQTAVSRSWQGGHLEQDLCQQSLCG